MSLLQELSDQELATHVNTYHYGDPLAAELAKRLEAYDGTDEELEEAQDETSAAEQALQSDRELNSGACDEIRYALDQLQDRINAPDDIADKYAAEIRTLCDRIEA